MTLPFPYGIGGCDPCEIWIKVDGVKRKVPANFSGLPRRCYVNEGLGSIVNKINADKHPSQGLIEAGMLIYVLTPLHRVTIGIASLILLVI